MTKKKRILSTVIALVMMLTTVVTGTVGVSAASAETGALLWYYRDSSVDTMRGISSVTLDEGYLYAASGKNLYKINAATGSVAATAALDNSVGYNKIAPTVADTPSGRKVLVALGSATLGIVDADTMKVEKTVTYAENQSSHQSLTPSVYSADDNSVYLGSWRKGYGGTYAKVSLDDYSVKEIQNSETGFYWSGACAEGDYVVFGSVSNGTDDPNTPSDGDAQLYVYDKSAETVASVTLPDSGSVCSTVKESNGKYYFTSKSGKFYEVAITDGIPEITGMISLGAKSTCTPCIADGTAYVGAVKKVFQIDLSNMTLAASYDAPADVKQLTFSNGTLYATYNNAQGGIYNVMAETVYFLPDSSMQNYCVSSIAAASDGTLYYTNDSNYIMAVRDFSDILTPTVAAQEAVTATMTAANAFNIKWSSQTVAWSPRVSTKATVKYKVQMQQEGKSWTTLASAATATSLKKTGLTKGVRYAFRVTPYVTVNGKNYYGAAKTTAYQYTLKAPASKPTVKKASGKYVKVSWKAVNGADGYQIYKSEYKNKKFTKAKTVSSKYRTAKIKVAGKKVYYYKVRAYKKVGSKYIYGPWSTVSKGYKLK